MSATTIMRDEQVTASWQRLMDKGRVLLDERALEAALHQFTTALNLCETCPRLLAHRKYLVLGNIGWLQRLSGRYTEAIETLENALSLADAVDGPPTRERVQIAGELGTIFRLMGRHEDAKHAFQTQYETAKEMGLHGATCRSIGNIAMANYQRALALWEADDSDPGPPLQIGDLIINAITQLQERISRALAIQKYEEPFSGHGASIRSKKAAGWAAIAYSRLSLCYALLASIDPDKGAEHLEEAEQHALQGVNTMKYIHGASYAFARFFYGRILLRRGKGDLAMAYFNPHKGTNNIYWHPTQATPAIVFAKEPSDEHRGYLRELVDAGAEFDVMDNEGYDALQYAVSNDDTESEVIILEGLRKQGFTPADLVERQETARLRKGYREILQEKIRPMLHQTGKQTLKALRRTYTETIAGDREKAMVFDCLKYIRYTDFVNFGRLPRSTDGLVKKYALGKDGEDRNSVDYLIFFSYRWINPDRSSNTPDDEKHTQYRRMVDAAKQFLQQHQEVDRQRLCIWMDFACVDQDDPSKGVSALPIMVAQCDATISLVDDDYYQRAWCCVEVMMIRSLAYRRELHKWFEHVPVETADEQAWELRDTSTNYRYLTMDKKLLTYENDRPKVMFLERQSKLLQPV